MERARPGFLWRPGLEFPPLVRAGFEHVGFGGNEVRVIFQIAAEKRKFNFFAIILGSFRTEIDVADFVAFAASPTAVSPWTHYEDVGDAGIHAFGAAINLERTK